MTKKDYISVVYEEKRTPKTNYPFMLTKYLFERFKMQKGMKLLEIGCGRGEFLEAFQHLGMEVYGLDLSSYCDKHNASLEVKCADISKDNIPYDDNFFDVVYHKSLIEHLYNPENLMNETFRVLKPGGKVVILTPDWVSQMEVFYEDFTHARPYTEMALLDLLKVYGFSETHTELFYQLPILWEKPFLKVFSCLLRKLMPTLFARKLTEITGIKFFRWSVELMVLGTGAK